MHKRILLGIDFSGSNYTNARKSIHKWWEYITADGFYECMAGISNFCDRFQPLPDGDGISPTDVLKEIGEVIPKSQLLQWTTDIDNQLLGTVRQYDCRSVPFYSSFNYGSVNNRLLIIANSYECDYMIRIDPGTEPPKGVSFTPLMREHEKIIGGETCTVVSRMYAERFALRSMFAKRGYEKHHADLVEEYTGIDVFSQVTGGAMLTQRTPGTPAICFPPGDGLTLVWGSDDGIYQQLPQTRKKSTALLDFPVERFDAVGKSKTSSEYYRGILGAVFVKALRDGKSRAEAEDILDRFMQELKEDIVDMKKCIRLDQEQDWPKYFNREGVAPSRFLDSIIKGYRNHEILLKEWPKICAALKDAVVKIIGG